MINLENLFLNTPIAEIEYQYNRQKNKVYASLEWFSLTGSIKDKVAYFMLKSALQSGKLKRGDKIVEISSGNMGISLACIANLFGLKTTILMPKNMSIERKQLLKLYGATLVEVEDFAEAYKICDEYIKQGYYCCNQFGNKKNTLAHIKFTANNFIKKLETKNVKNFVAGVGTAGTLMGVGKALKKSLKVNIVGVQPLKAQILTTPPPYLHHELQGLSDEKCPKLYEKEKVDKVISISDDDALAMAQKLCKDLSLGVGISSGANFLACVLTQENAITTFADDNKKYLSTKLSTPIATNLVDGIKLLKVKFI